MSLHLSNPEAVREEARIARQKFGFLRMWSIHPSQIQPIIEEMQTSFSELELACAVLTKAQNVNWAPVRHENLLYDRASYRLLLWSLKRAKFLGQKLPEGSVGLLCL